MEQNTKTVLSTIAFTIVFLALAIALGMYAQKAWNEREQTQHNAVATETMQTLVNTVHEQTQLTLVDSKNNVTILCVDAAKVQTTQ